MSYVGYLWSLIIVCLDQITKNLAESNLIYAVDVNVLPFLSWRVLYNTGIAFSFFAEGDGWQRWVFSFIAFVFAGYLINELRKLDRQPWYGFAYASILGGALGNMIDRVGHGYVVDFIFVNYDWFQFPVFNVADSAVSVGAAVWIALMITEMRKGRR